jgi:hypothetical protein
MYRSFRFRVVWSGIVAGLILTTNVFSQEVTREFWPEIDVWWRVTPSWRFSMFLPIAKNVETKYREGNIILQGDYVWGKNPKFHPTRLYDESRSQVLNAFMARGGYLEGRSLGDKGQTYKENTAFGELHFRSPIKGRILISHRLRCDLRWLGSENEFSQRIRYRLMIEKDYTLTKVSLVPYFNVEPYYDTRFSTVNRVRLIGGSSVSWSSRYAFEGNITYQYDSYSSVTNLLAFNVIFHLYFESVKKEL